MYLIDFYYSRKKELNLLFTVMNGMFLPFKLFQQKFNFLIIHKPKYELTLRIKIYNNNVGKFPC